MYQKKRKKKNQHSGYGTLRLRMEHSPKPVSQQKFTFIHCKSSFHRIYLTELRSACSSPLSAAYSLWQFACHWEFFFSPCWQKKNLPNYFICLRQASGVSGLVSFLLALKYYFITSAMWHLRGWWIISLLDHQNIVFYLTILDNFFEHQSLPASVIRKTF